MKPAFAFLALFLLATLGAQAADQTAEAEAFPLTIQDLADLDAEPILSTDIEVPEVLAAGDAVNACPFPPPNPPANCICGSCCVCGACWMYPGGPGEFCGFGES